MEKGWQLHLNSYGLMATNKDFDKKKFLDKEVLYGGYAEYANLCNVFYGIQYLSPSYTLAELAEDKWQSHGNLLCYMNLISQM